MHISHIFHRFQVTCNKCTTQFNHTYILCSYMWTVHVLPYTFHRFSGILRSLEQGTFSCNMHISHIFHRFQVTCNKCTIQFNHTYILCSYMWTMHVRLLSVPLHWHKMYRKCPEHPRSRLLTTATERNKFPTGCYFFSPLLFSPLIWMHLWQILLFYAMLPLKVELSSFSLRNCVKCEGILINVWLLCMVNMQYSDWCVCAPP